MYSIGISLLQYYKKVLLVESETYDNVYVNISSMYYASRGKRANPVMDMSSKVTENQNTGDFRGIKCFYIKY